MGGKRYEVQHFDFADGGRSWHVYDKKEHCHIHTASSTFLKSDKSEPVCCTKICSALNLMENMESTEAKPKKITLRIQDDSLGKAIDEYLSKKYPTKTKKIICKKCGEEVTTR